MPPESVVLIAVCGLERACLSKVVLSLGVAEGEVDLLASLRELPHILIARSMPVVKRLQIPATTIVPGLSNVIGEVEKEFRLFKGLEVFFTNLIEFGLNVF